MTVRVVPFLPEHLADMNVQEAQPEMRGDRMAIGAGLARGGRCFTALRTARCSEVPVFCGGVVRTHADYVTMWAAVARDAGPDMLAIDRRVRRFIAMLPEQRIDTVVRKEFEAGRRWVFALGFRLEATLRGYFADGEDAVIYRLAGRD